jgi:O-methyltransferase involved in polyketide biosynthesis
MVTEKIAFPEEKTLLDTLYAKALDSQADDPILGDTHAAEVVTKLAFDFGRTKVTPANAGIVALRARQLDAWVKEFVAGHPDAIVLHLGCGLDTRVNRIDPPATVRWYDVDYPDVIEKRRRVCPPHPAAELIGASVIERDWLDTVPADGPGLVIGEGLFMYLAEDDGKRLMRRLTEHFPSGEMVFDAFSRAWIRLERLNRLIQAEGGVHWGIDDPAELERELPLRSVSALSAFAIPGTERLHRPYATLFRAFAAVPRLNRGVRLLRYRW